MTYFKNFANGEKNDELAKAASFIPPPHKRNNSVGSRVEKVWATDFEKCKTREEYENYISKYGRYESNPYIAQARSKITTLRANEEAVAKLSQAGGELGPATDHTLNSPSNISCTKSELLHTILKASVWLLIIGATVYFSYYRYQQNQTKQTSDVLITPTAINDLQDSPQNSQSQQSNPDYAEELEQPVTESHEEPQEIWWDCTICGATGRCQHCFGSGCCGICGGGGSLYRSTGWIDCGNCGGSGRCPSCEGSGFCFACQGRGKCKLESQID